MTEKETSAVGPLEIRLAQGDGEFGKYLILDLPKNGTAILGRVYRREDAVLWSKAGEMLEALEGLLEAVREDWNVEPAQAAAHAAIAAAKGQP